MALFDQKNFNGEVFGAYVDQVENLNRNELLKSGAIVERPGVCFPSSRTGRR